VKGEGRKEKGKGEREEGKGCIMAVGGMDAPSGSTPHYTSN